MLEASPSKRLTHESLAAEINPLMPGFLTNKKTAETLREELHRIIDTHADKTPVLDSFPGLKPRTIRKRAEAIVPPGFKR